MKKLILFTVLICAVSLTGCDVLKTGYKQYKKVLPKEKVESASEPLIKPIEDIDLAKLILKPEKKKVTIKRDPFKPLIDEHNKQEMAAKVAQITANPEDVLRNMEYLGMVKISKEYSALLKTDNEKGVFGINDVINKLTVIDIQKDQVVLKSGTNTYILKRGEK